MTTLVVSDRARRLSELIERSEDDLMQRVLAYARRQEFTRYTSTLIEAWRASIAGLSQPILNALAHTDAVPELFPDEDFSHDPIASFGILEAQRHRARGVGLGMFLGLMKYYRQSYVDVIASAGFAPEDEAWAQLFVGRLFDRVELGYCTEWAATSTPEQVDELQAANRRLANEKNKFLTLFSSLGPPILLLDRDDRVTDMNFAAERLFLGTQRPGETYYGTPVRRLLPPALAESVESFHLDGRPQLRVAVTLGEGAGEASGAPRRDFDVHLHRMLDVSGKFDGVTLVLHDVTERLRMARELQDASVALERRVAERTRELRRALESLHAETLEKERVAAEQRRLEGRMHHVQRLESLGVLAGGVAHDFNDLLAAILGNAELVARELPEDSAHLERLNHIQDAARHAAGLCGQMLAYGGHGPVATQEVDLAEMLNGMSDSLRSSLPPGATLDVRLGAGAVVRGDAAHLRQVVSNLVTNAAEALGEPHGRITLELACAHCDRAALEDTAIGPELDEGDYAVLSVSDDGCGMDEATLAHVFDPFFSTKALGRGLGMAAALGIVRGHHGTIGIRTRRHAGTTVRVHLPLTHAPAALPAAAAAGPARARGPRAE